MNDRDTFICSFCGNQYSKCEVVNGLHDAIICEDCIMLYSDLFKEEDMEDDILVLSPKEIYDALNKTIIGQDNAKKRLAVAVSNHYKRIKYKLDIEKGNVLLIGPTGCGKTLIAKTLAQILNVPYAICDATVYTEAGYVGEDVENILLRLLQNANYDKPKAEIGIVFIDEIDKLTRKSENPSITKDVSGEGVQNALLKIIEGSIVNVPPFGGRKHPYQEYIRFDTSKVLFICAGAFLGLEKLTDNKQIGFNKEYSSNKVFLNEQIIKYGIVPELLGRLPNIIVMDQLTTKELEGILTNPYNGLINQYQKLLNIDNININFDPCVIKMIADKAKKSFGGARSLKHILENIMSDIIFNSEKSESPKEYLITKEHFKEYY